MSRFTGRVFLISGGARGLGAAQARRLVAEGGRVVIGDVLIQEGRQLAAELGDACTFKALDVTSEAQWSDAVETAEGDDPYHRNPRRGLEPFELRQRWCDVCDRGEAPDSNCSRYVICPHPSTQ